MWLELLTIFAVWRVTSLLAHEKGPYYIFRKLRKWALRNKIKVLDCFWCISIWIAIPFALFSDHFFISWLGLSGMAILLDQIVEKYDV